MESGRSWGVIKGLCEGSGLMGFNVSGFKVWGWVCFLGLNTGKMKNYYILYVKNPGLGPRVLYRRKKKKEHQCMI